MDSQIDFTKGSFSYDLSDFVIVYFCLVHFISDVRPDLQCDPDFTVKRISSLAEYDRLRRSSIDFSASTKVSASGGYYGISLKASASYALVMDATERAAEKVLQV